MTILGVHAGHNGGVATLEAGRLVTVDESAKDSNARYSDLRPETLERALYQLSGLPDVIATGGWWDLPGGYRGVDARPPVPTDTERAPAGPIRTITSHERAHIMGAYGMSPFPQGRPVYCLVWEGEIGSFYEIDRDLNIRVVASPLSNPGQRYAFLYELGDPTAPDTERGYSMQVAGKLMALAAYGADTDAAPIHESAVRALIEGFHPGKTTKGDFRDHPCYNAGLTSGFFQRVAAGLTDAIFDEFYQAATSRLTKGWPLIISGGCGLNCDWNSRWLGAGLFDDVFVPPCPDDSGVALGAAIDGQWITSGSAKIDWHAWSGLAFKRDTTIPDDFARESFSPSRTARLLAEGAVLAFVQGRYEIGPRALGHRSILAEPSKVATRDRLNWIKRREDYRPIAPVCLEEDVSRWFDRETPSPHMLYFARVRNGAIAAVTHVDGSARPQTVDRGTNVRLRALLEAFRELTGVAVLCNTSLNFPGLGFINRTTDLLRFVIDRDLDGMVIDEDLFLRKRRPSGQGEIGQRPYP